MKTIEPCIKYVSYLLILSLMILSGCHHPPKKEPIKASLQSEPNPEKAAQLNVRLGLSYLEQKQMSRAKLKLNRAMKLAPHLPEVHYGMGFYFEEVGETEAARSAYQQALVLNPQGGIEHNNYGAFLCRHQEYRASEKEFLQAVKDPNYVNAAEALENAGLCVLQIPDETKAAEYFKRALRHDAKRYHALIELAYIHYFKKEFEIATQYYEQYKSIAHPTARSLWLGIQLARHFKNAHQASSDLLLLKDYFPHSKEYKELNTL